MDNQSKAKLLSESIGTLIKEMHVKESLEDWPSTSHLRDWKEAVAATSVEDKARLVDLIMKGMTCP